MKEAFQIILIVAVSTALFFGAIYGGVAVTDYFGDNRCRALGQNAGISTSYFSGACHISVCGAWVDSADLPYFLNSAIECGK